jgi:hypothetical protein
MPRSQVPEIELDYIYQSKPYTLTITITNSVGPIDVTASTFASQLRRYPASSDIAATFTIDTSQANVGVIQLALDSATTASLEPGPYRWDVDKIDGTTITPLAKAEIIVEGDVTR